MCPLLANHGRARSRGGGGTAEQPSQTEGDLDEPLHGGQQHDPQPDGRHGAQGLGALQPSREEPERDDRQRASDGDPLVAGPESLGRLSGP